MKSRQVSIVTPTARERFSTARPMLLLIAITVIALLGSVFLSQMGYNSEPVGIRNRHGDGAGRSPKFLATTECPYAKSTPIKPPLWTMTRLSSSSFPRA